MQNFSLEWGRFIIDECGKKDRKFSPGRYRTIVAEMRAVLLESMTGAKEVIKKHAGEAHFLSFQGGEVDVDTPDDFSRLVSEAP